MDEGLRPKRLFDEKCYELAEYFTREPAGKYRAEDTNELAQFIQSCIEDWLTDDDPEFPV